MAGQDQSANLGGMLTDIGKTVGSMGDAYTPVLNEATRPRGDMDDPKHVQRMAEWSARTGDTASAQMYASQARELQKEARAKTTATAMNTATSAYSKALKTGDPTKIDEAYNGLQEAASVNGLEAQSRVDGVQRAHREQVNAADVQAEKVRVNKERAALEALSTAINGAKQGDLADIVKNADPSVATAAQKMANTRTAWLQNEEKIANDNKLNKTALNTDIYIDPSLPPETIAALEQEQAQLAKDAEDGFVNGTWLPNARRGLEERRIRLSERAFSAANSMHSTEQAMLNQRTGEYRRALRDVERGQGTKAERKAIEDDIKATHKVWVDDDPITEQQVTDIWRTQQREGLSRAYPEIVTGGETTRTFTDAEEARITEAMAQNKGATREQIIAKLYPPT